jgi:hypothetical protein
MQDAGVDTIIAGLCRPFNPGGIGIPHHEHQYLLMIPDA